MFVKVHNRQNFNQAVNSLDYVVTLAGVGVAFLASLIFKTKFLRHHHTPLESCMVILFALSSYMIADSFGLSGIVSILFCGLVRTDMSLT